MEKMGKIDGIQTNFCRVTYNRRQFIPGVSEMIRNLVIRKMTSSIVQSKQLANTNPSTYIRKRVKCGKLIPTVILVTVTVEVYGSTVASYNVACLLLYRSAAAHITAATAAAAAAAGGTVHHPPLLY